MSLSYSFCVYVHIVQLTAYIDGKILGVNLNYLENLQINSGRKFGSNGLHIFLIDCVCTSIILNLEFKAIAKSSLSGPFVLDAYRSGMYFLLMAVLVDLTKDCTHSKMLER